MIVQAPDGTEIEFPDDTPENVMADAMRRYVAEASVDRGVDRAQQSALARTGIGRRELEENLVNVDPRLSGAAHVNDVAAGVALPAAAAGAALPYIAPTALKVAASPLTSAAIGGYTGFKSGGLVGAIEGAAKGAIANKILGIGGGKLVDWANRIRALRAMKTASSAVPAVAETVAPVAAASAETAPAVAQVSTAAPATLSKAEAAAKLEALLGSAVKEGRVAAAAKEAAKGNRQLAEKILGDLQGEGVIAP